MAKETQIDVGKLSNAVLQELNRYDQEVVDVLKKETKKVARETTQRLKESSPRTERSGQHYAEGWSSKTAFDGKDDIRIIIHNRVKPFLTHLLEKGHASRNGGRVEAIPHIAPAEEAAAKKLLDRVKVGIRNL